MRLPKRFMVIDDDPVNNQLCEYIMQRYNKNIGITIYTDVISALNGIAEEYGNPDSNTPTVIFLDINMPEISGWGFLEKFKLLGEAIQKQFVIYILSSSIDDRDMVRAASDPLVTGFISKPLTPEILEDIINSNYGIKMMASN